MFAHNFKYTLKALFRNKMLLFWTYAFPVIMGLLFYLAFSNIESTETMGVIDIAVVENDAFAQSTAMKTTLELLGEEDGENRIFNITYTNTEEEAEGLLSDGKITGYLLVPEEGKPQVVVKESGIYETIFQAVIGEVMQMEDMISESVEAQAAYGIDVDVLVDSVMTQLSEEGIEINDISSANLSYTMIEYYSLIAMTCLYGAMLGMSAINNVLASMSGKGMRVTVSPVHKWQTVLGSLLAAYIAQLVGLVILFAFTIFALHVDYGTQIAHVVLLAVTGALAGTSIGVAIGACLKKNENAKTGILISVTMLGSFFAGMMGIGTKYVVDTNVPILNKLNPVNMITDGLYALYYYGVSQRYWMNIVSLLVFSALLFVVSSFALKKQTIA